MIISHHWAGHLHKEWWKRGSCQEVQMEELGVALMLLFHVNQQPSQGTSYQDTTDVYSWPPHPSYTLCARNVDLKNLKNSDYQMKSGSEVVTPRDISTTRCGRTAVYSLPLYLGTQRTEGGRPLMLKCLPSKWEHCSSRKSFRPRGHGSVLQERNFILRPTQNFPPFLGLEWGRTDHRSTSLCFRDHFAPV